MKSAIRVKINFERIVKLQSRLINLKIEYNYRAMPGHEIVRVLRLNFLESPHSLIVTMDHL